MPAREKEVREALRFDAVVETSDQPGPDAQLVREQAAVIAHYKKMYDRSSALARIGVWECDLATEKLTWTDGVYDLFELPRGSPLQRVKIVEMYDDDSRVEMERLRAEAIRTGGSFSLDIHIRTERGRMRWLRLTADVEQEDGRSVRIFGTKQDITEARAAQEKVKALQAELIHVSRRSAMGAMAATLAHELNQPLAAIGNYVAGTRRTLNSHEPAKEILELGLDAIEQNAFRAGNILRSLRDVVSGSALETQKVNPNRLIREAAALAVTGSRERPDLNFRLADDVVLSIDPVEFRQVMINLIENAVEAVEGLPRREITVSTFVADGVVEIRVDDTGRGIASEMMPSLFEAFVSSKPEGTGVGLAISRTIIEAYGGRIVAANGESGGASFCLVLPLATDAEVPEPDADGAG